MSIVRQLLTAMFLLSLAGAPLAPSPAAQVPKTSASRSAATPPVDLNTASREALKRLPGIGDAYADRIVRGRPYTAKNQLTQRGILPEAAYAKIRDLVVARRR